VQQSARQRKETSLDMRKLLPLANHCNVSIITRNETLGQRFESPRRLFFPAQASKYSKHEGSLAHS
jgi:hypothetical protein